MKYIYIIIFYFLGIFSINIYSQDTTSNKTISKVPRIQEVTKSGEGKEFWLCFMKNYKDADASTRQIDLDLFITGDYDATVTIEFAKIGYKEVVQLKAGTVAVVKMDRMAQTISSEQVDAGQAIHIVSDRPVTVYGLNKRFQTTDTFLGYPAEVLGTEYMVLSFSSFSEWSSTCAVAATEDNTEIRITPSVETMNGRPADKPFTVTMNKGDVYQVAAKLRNNDTRKSDLTGTTITSNKKIAVFGGHQCANVPSLQVTACNHLVEQMPPIQTWGKNFYIGKFKMRSSYTYRVLAAHDNTKVFADTSLLATLMKGEYVERNSQSNIQITADKPVLVAQYSQGSQGPRGGDGVGDPMMLLVSPTQQFLKKYRFATPVNGDWHHLINVIVPTKAIKTFRVDGLPQDVEIFEKLGVSKFSVASIRLAYGSHTVECTQPFGLYSYGFGFGQQDGYDAYGNMGGQSFIDYEPAIDTIPPQIQLTSQDKNNTLLVSDDEMDDTGILDISAIETLNMNVKIPNFANATPSVLIDFNVINPTEPAKLAIKVRDMALNEVFYTVCYVFDNTSQQYVFILNRGAENDCLPTQSIMLGAFYMHSYNNYTPKFNSTNNISGQVDFIGNSGRGGLFGFSASRYLVRGFNVSAKLLFATNDAVFSSIDTIKQFVTDSITGNYVPYFSGKEIKLDNFVLNIDLGLDYRISEYFYLSGGISCGLGINKRAECSENIFFPPGYSYDNNTNKHIISDKLSSLSTFNFGLYLGPGVQCNIGHGFYVFADINYYYYLTSQLKDADLSLSQTNIKFGVKYKLQ